VPFVDEIVPEVDLAGGRVTVVDRPGLLAEEKVAEEKQAEEKQAEEKQAEDSGQNGE